jgi:hypothetical protein
MTPAERVLATFKKEKLDKVAVYHSGFSSEVGSNLLGRTSFTGGGINRWREACALWEGPDSHAEFLERTEQDTADLAEIAKTDMVRIAYWRLPEKPTKRIDENTFLYGDPDGEYRVFRLSPRTELYQCIDSREDHPVETVDDLERQVVAMEEELSSYHPTAADFDTQMRWHNRYGGARAIPTAGYGLAVPNQEAIWLEATILRPDLVDRLLDVHCERSCRQIEAQKDLPLLYHMGGGDFCGNHGPNYSPQFFHDHMLPRLKRMSATAHRYGKFGIFATDGDTWPVAEDLWGTSGTDAAHEIDRLAGMDHWKMRHRFPHLTCLGNISTITLYRGTKDDVIAETRDNCEAALELSGVMPGVSNQIPPGTPMENVLAMLNTIEEYH